VRARERRAKGESGLVVGAPDASRTMVTMLALA
jgi:hypothetical protein